MPLIIKSIITLVIPLVSYGLDVGAGKRYTVGDYGCNFSLGQQLLFTGLHPP
jgi:hypothetical protein